MSRNDCIERNKMSMFSEVRTKTSMEQSCIDMFLFLCAASTWKMAPQRWTEAPEVAVAPRRAQASFSRLCHSGERASFTAVTAISRCRRNRCRGTVRSPAKGERFAIHCLLDHPLRWFLNTRPPVYYYFPYSLRRAWWIKHLLICLWRIDL